MNHQWVRMNLGKSGPTRTLSTVILNESGPTGEIPP